MPSVMRTFLDKHKENHLTSREADNTDINILTPLEIQNILNQNNLKLNAYYSNQRYVCRVTDRTTGAIASLSSCETLSKAVSIAVYNAMSHAHA